MGSEDRMATAAGLLLTLGLLSPISASSFVEPLVPIEKESEDISTATCPEKWIDASFVNGLLAVQLYNNLHLGQSKLLLPEPPQRYAARDHYRDATGLCPDGSQRSGRP